MFTRIGFLSLMALLLLGACSPRNPREFECSLMGSKQSGQKMSFVYDKESKEVTYVNYQDADKKVHLVGQRHAGYRIKNNLMWKDGDLKSGIDYLLDLEKMTLKRTLYGYGDNIDGEVILSCKRI